MKTTTKRPPAKAVVGARARTCRAHGHRTKRHADLCRKLRIVLMAGPRSLVKAAAFNIDAWYFAVSQGALAAGLTHQKGGGQ